MRVHDLIGAFYAIDAFRAKARGLQANYRPGTPARQALDEALAALDRFDAATIPPATIAEHRPSLAEAGP